jgi:hypothetical protein
MLINIKCTKVSTEMLSEEVALANVKNPNLSHS